jgi:hypothetical protein
MWDDPRALARCVMRVRQLVLCQTLLCEVIACGSVHCLMLGALVLCQVRLNFRLGTNLLTLKDALATIMPALGCMLVGTLSFVVGARAWMSLLYRKDDKELHAILVQAKLVSPDGNAVRHMYQGSCSLMFMVSILTAYLSVSVVHSLTTRLRRPPA